MPDIQLHYLGELFQLSEEKRQGWTFMQYVEYMT